ncbi:adenosylcobinamide kinase/adenosylcobinamide-phosphate guanylyltransferase [Clostridiales Family XIII bacterium PM5-7]
MNIFISGGCKNGKSMYAQQVAKSMAENKGVPLYYVATMIPTDDEDRSRIKRHIGEREGWGFTTLEQGKDICNALTDSVNAQGVFLLDSVTALLSNEMFGADGIFDEHAERRVATELLEFARRTGNTVFVSDYIYSDAKFFDEYTDRYRRALAYVDQQLAKACDQVIEVAYGQKYFLKRQETK